MFGQQNIVFTNFIISISKKKLLVTRKNKGKKVMLKKTWEYVTKSVHNIVKPIAALLVLITDNIYRERKMISKASVKSK